MPTRPKYFKPFAWVKARPTASEAERKRFYNSAAWRRCRDAFLRSNPLCVECEAEGKLTEASIAHHVVERLEDPGLSFDHDNLKALCPGCHTGLHKTRPSKDR